MSYYGPAPKERSLSPVQCPFVVHMPATTSAVRRASPSSSRVAPPPERQREQWRACACHAKAGWFLKAVADMSHHSRVPKERGLSPAPCPFVVYGPITTGAARRARSKLACSASSRETAGAVARSLVPRESRLILGDRSWHVTPRPRAEGERPLAGAVPFCGARNDHNQRGTAHARSKLACCASSRETASSVSRLRAPRESRLVIGGRSWRVAPRPRAEGERPLASAVALPGT